MRLDTQIKVNMNSLQSIGKNEMENEKYDEAVSTYERAMELGFKHIHPNDTIMKEIKIDLESAKSKSGKEEKAESDSSKNSMSNHIKNSSIGRSKVTIGKRAPGKDILDEVSSKKNFSPHKQTSNSKYRTAKQLLSKDLDIV